MTNPVDFVYLDFETADTTTWKTVVLSFSAIAGRWSEMNDVRKSYFDDKMLNIVFDVKSQTQLYHRTTNKDTLNWWSKQPENVRAQFKTDNKMDIKDFPLAFNQYLSKLPICQKTKIFCRGTDFDIPIIQSIYKHFDIPILYGYSSVRDVRTALDILCDEQEVYKIQHHLKTKHDLKKHISLDDCILDCLTVHHALTN